MNNQVLTILEYDKVKAMLADLTVSGLGRELVERLQPMTQHQAIESALLETSEAQAILSGGAHVPLRGLGDVREPVERADKGGILGPLELVRIADCLRGCRELKRYMESKRAIAPNLSRYAEAITVFRALEDEIYVSIEGSRVSSSASDRLAKIRREMQLLEERIQAKLQSFLTSHQYRDALQDSFISLKDGRYVLPIKASHRNKVDGLVIEASGSGLTVFVEPAAVRKMVNELQALKAEEEAEEYQVLVALSGLLAAETRVIMINLEVMAAYDFALAKGRLSLSMAGRLVPINNDGFIQIVQGRHPLIAHGAVPLDLTLGRSHRTLVITGPNTGGKTVALKTLGLLTLMVQSGLLVPVGQRSQFAIFERILADIGDGQSIEHSLSTFSSHMGVIAAILRQADRSSLVLLDEVGTGTDPAEGAALAMAILEELHESGAVTLATTHYSDVKRLSDLHPGFINGRMDFDPNTLQPLYRLIMGEAGSSHALWIAERLGISPKVLGKARSHLGMTADSSHLGMAADSGHLGMTADSSHLGMAADSGHLGMTVDLPGANRLQPLLGESGEENKPGTHREAPGNRVQNQKLADPPGQARITDNQGETTVNQGQTTGNQGQTTDNQGETTGNQGQTTGNRRPWQVGDSVMIRSIGQRGVIAELPNARGEMVIFTRGKRIMVNHKQVTLVMGAEHLYPEGYDLRVATYTWEDRRLMHDMQRKHVDGYRVVSEGHNEGTKR